MLNSIVLDVAIGMAFVYLLLSLIASVVQEILATFMRLRAANLQRAIRSLVSGASTEQGIDLVDSIYNHGLVRGLYSDPKVDSNAADPAGLWATLWNGIRNWDWIRKYMRLLIGIHPEKDVNGVSSQMLLPSYIPAPTFSMTLIDLLNKNKAVGPAAMQQIEDFLRQHRAQFQANKATEALLTLTTDAQGDLKKFQTNVENWYSAAMDRASGWYKKYAQSMLLVIGMILAVSLNVDTIHVGETLWGSTAARQGMLDAASQYVKTHPNPPTTPSTSTSDSTTPATAPATKTPTPDTPTADTKTPAPVTTPFDPNELKSQLKGTVDQFQDVTTKSLLPVGWKDPERWATRFRNILHHPCTSLGHLWDRLQRVSTWELLVGWLLTALAISLGAPFWFDTLNRFMVVRGTVKPDEKSGPEPSKG